MKKFLLFLLLLFPGCNSDDKVIIKLIKPDNYNIGELVILDATASKADKLIWKIIPETTNFKIMNKLALFSSPEPIDYTLILIATKGPNADCQIFTLTPEKEKKEKKVTLPLTKFERKVKQWLNDADLSDKKQALQLAQSFAIIARTIELGTYETVDGLILATAWANSDALGDDLEAWKPFLRDFQDHLEINPPKMIEDHVPVWKNMAAALKKLFP